MNGLPKAFSSLNASSQEESELGEYFVVTKAIEKVADPSSKESVLVGVKGIGKTAAFRYFSEFSSSSDILIALDPSRYAIHLSKTSHSPTACSHEFEYEITIELLSKFISEKKKFKNKVDPKLFGEAKTHKDSFWDKLKEFGGRLAGGSILGCGLQLSDPKVSILTGLKGRQDEDAAISTLRRVCNAGVTMRLIIDDPEEMFSSTESVDESLIGGLLIAAAKLNELSDNIKIIVLIKSHVFETVLESVADFDKYPNCYERLWWSPDELQQVIAKRVIHFCDLNGDQWYKTVFGTKFNEADLAKLFKYILPNLRNGPRDLILWFQLALKKANEKKRAYITSDDFQAVFSEMSRKSLATLGAIYNKRYARLVKVIKLVFGGVAVKEFTPEELATHVKSLTLDNIDYQGLMNLPWLASIPSFDLPEFLFRCGALGFRWDKQQILPYMSLYELDKFEDAERYFLIPALVPSVKAVEKSMLGVPKVTKKSKRASK